MSDAATAAERLHALGLDDADLDGWLATGLPDSQLDDWMTDRIARKPTGQRARRTYGAEDIHDFARRAILDALHLGPGDRLLDIGCGGGLLLRDAMAFGAVVTGLDHSPEMVALARERAPGATVVEGRAERLPFADSTFTAVSMSVVFFFFDEPDLALEEARRVLRPGGRLAVYTTAPELRGTPAAPEPLASRGHFYADDELADLAQRAGFRDAAVRRDAGGGPPPGVADGEPDGGQLLTATAPEP